jgi:DNA mismatch repair protein MutH
MNIITRFKAIDNLKKYIGKELSDFSSEFNITILKDGKVNKGWKGLVVERLAGLENNNKKAPNGIGYEIKSTSFKLDKKSKVLVPKETFAITMINIEEFKIHSFYESHCWQKIKSLIICPTSWDKPHSVNSKLIGVYSVDLLETDNILIEIEADYEMIRRKLNQDGPNSLKSRDGKWIQVRTKGGKNSTSRAFYARKNLIKYLCDKN